MPRVPVRLMLAPFFGLAFVFAEARGRDDAPRRNLVLFLVDDLGWQDCSVPHHSASTPFNERYRTPHLERLAAEGVVFTQAYASAPVCTPTRTSIMTGRSPAANDITYWILHGDQDTSAKHPMVRAPEWNIRGLQEEDSTLPRILSDAGYVTIHAGKAHLGARGTSGADPHHLGFAVNIAGHAAGGPGSFYGAHDFSAAWRGGGNVWDVPGLEEYHGRDVFLTEAIAERALAELDDPVTTGTPFFLHFAPYAVHAPIMANRRYLDSYAELDEREASYATMIETVDAALGALLAKLSALGVLEETAIIFTSDNGGLSAHARGGEKHSHNAPLRSGKGSAYEGGVRVPFVTRIPGVTRAGTRSDVPVISHDLFPTLLALADVDVPDDHDVEGVDLMPAFGGGPLEDERDLYWHMPHFWGVHGPGIEPYSAVRSGDWKLLWFHPDRRLELYDLATDVGESRDVAAKEPEVVKRLTESLSKWLARTDAGLSIDVETGDPVALPRR